jgi:hypothetical protein
MPKTSGWTIGGILKACLFLALGWLLLHQNVQEASFGQEPGKAGVKWEYCTLVNDHSGKCGFNNSKEAIGADNWKDLAKKLKVPLKEGEDNDRTIRMAVFDSLGAQGWELAGQSSIAVNATFVETFSFKRRVEK